jgi:hypothetical protein
MSRVKKIFCSFLVLFSLLICPTSRGANYTEPPECYLIKTQNLSRTIGIQNQVLRHTAFNNSLAERSISIQGQEFEIWLRDDKLKATDFKVKEVKTDQDHILVILDHREKPLGVELHYRAEPDSFYIHKWLELRPKNSESLFVDRIVLEHFKPWYEPVSFPGPGQPVYVEDNFFGVEYPSAENQVRDAQVFCSYLVGLEVGEEGLVSRKAVFGASEKDKVEFRFLQYVDEVRARPLSPFLLYNTWYDMRHFSADQVIASLKGFRENFNEPYNIQFDSVVLDSGWDDYLDCCWKPHHRRFPQGFEPVRKEAEKSGARIGLWMSPLGGYIWRQWARLIGSIGKGYEKSWQGFCIAGPNYHECFRESMIKYMREYGVNYYKLDNLTTSCPNPRHGHRTGRYGQAGLTDAFIDILDAARAENPDVMLNITRGAWLSPWWLMHADVVWVGGMDYGYAGKGTKRQRSITYRDRIMYKRFGQEKAQFPINSLMTHGIIKGGKALIGGKDESLKGFKDLCIMYFGRGVMMQELYLSPDTLSREEWEFLAKTIKWAEENWELLSKSRMVLGNPAQDEIYGYWHELDNQAMIVLRNPDDIQKSITLIWSQLLENKNMEVKLREVLYPGKEDIIYETIKAGMELSLKPFQTAVISFILNPPP